MSFLLMYPNSLIAVMEKMKNLFVLFFLIVPANIYSQNTTPPVEKGSSKFVNKPLLTRGPYLQVATDTSMVIRWRTDLLCRSRVRYGSSPAHLDKIIEDISLKTEHEIKLTGLVASTKYFYSVGTLKDTLQYGTDNYFSTL